jgi:hypothetical protein
MFLNNSQIYPPKLTSFGDRNRTCLSSVVLLFPKKRILWIINTDAIKSIVRFIFRGIIGGGKKN